MQSAPQFLCTSCGCPLCRPIPIDIYGLAGYFLFPHGYIRPWYVSGYGCCLLQSRLIGHAW